MSIISNVAPNGTISGPLPNMAPQQPTVLASAVTGMSAAARSLIPNAVIGSTTVPNYGEAPTQRNATDPSSQLAAQYLAQSPDTSDETLAIFTPRAQTQPQTAPAQAAPQDEFLTALRTARGDQPQAAASVAMQQQTANVIASNQAASGLATSNTMFNTAGVTTSAKPLTPSEARNLPPVTTSNGQRKPGIANARGASAYQVATTRNESSKVSAGVNAFL